MAKKIRNFAAILAISAVVGTMLLVLVFLLPVGPMRRNVEKSVGDMLKSGDEIPEDAFSKYLWKNRETYTDAIMVQNAIERLPDKNAYEHAMWMYHYDLEEDVWTPEDSLKAFCESHENVNNMYLHIYARYWHGYLLYLKPLLLLFSWKHVVWLELAGTDHGNTKTECRCRSCDPGKLSVHETGTGADLSDHVGVLDPDASGSGIYAVTS